MTVLAIRKEPSMSNVELGVPADLTAARIRRAARRAMGPAINEETAKEDAAIVHDIIACVRQAYAIQPTHPGWCGEEDDTIETILRTVAGVSPKDHDDACNEGEWMMFQLTHAEQLTGVRDIYRRWLRVVGHVKNFDYEDLFEDDEPMSDEDLLTQPEFASEGEGEGEGEDDDPGRRRRRRLHLVTGPELTGDDDYDLDRAFLALMSSS
jgi:hypothetical protein